MGVSSSVLVSVGEDQQTLLVEQQLALIDLNMLAEQTLQAVGITQPTTFSLLITDDAGIWALNKHYRDQDKPTDVLSFPLLEQPLVEAPIDQLWPVQCAAHGSAPDHLRSSVFVTPPDMDINLGDIVMSWPTITRQALIAGHEPVIELLYLLSHGLLHLVGYDDQTEAGYQSMVTIQQTVLHSLGYQL